MSPTSRPSLLGLAALAFLLLPAVARAQVEIIKDESFVASQVLDAPSSPWVKVGTGPSLAMPDGSLLINDNSSSEKVAFQALLGEVEADHRVALCAEMMVISNPGGAAVTMELARPGVEVVLRLLPQRVELVERVEDWGFRWMGSADVDLGDYRKVELHKASRVDDPHETVTVQVDGQEVLRAVPRGGGPLEVGRVVVGSLSYPGMGASLWKSVGYRLEAVSSSQVATEALSFGDLKSRYGSR